MFASVFFNTMICMEIQSVHGLVAERGLPACARGGKTAAVHSHVFGNSHSTFGVNFLSDRLGSIAVALLITWPTLLVLAVGPDIDAWRKARWPGSRRRLGGTLNR